MMEISFQIDSAAISDRGLSQKRPQNEDSFLEINEKGIFAVADGVGGAQAGEVASQMAVEILGEAFTNLRPGADAERVMRNALEQANSAIHQMSTDLAQLSKMATTVVALHVDKNIATIGHVGDSRLYRLDSDGTIHRETEDHSMVAEEVRAGRMTEEQAENHPSKNIISRALGAERIVQVDFKTMMIASDCTFLLCSDGVTRHIGDSELANLLASSETLSSICSRIKNICYERGAEDNLTAVLVKLSSESGKAQTSREDGTPSVGIDNSDDFLTVPELDEDTVAAARSFRTSESSDDDDFLELETAELRIPDAAIEVTPETAEVEEIVDTDIDEDLSLHETIPAHINNVTPEIEPETTQVIPQPSEEVEIRTAEVPRDQKNSGPVELQNIQPSPFVPVAVAGEPIPKSVPEQTYTPFNGTLEQDDLSTNHKSNGISRFLSYLGLLLLGACIGFGVYHFALKPTEQSPVIPISEMRSGNIPLSAFEDNRRLVDSDPATYLSKIPAPDDAESFYLQGRAYMLTGDFIKARAAFIEARNRIGKADPVNTKVIISDIAIAMAISNDPTAQKNFKAELEASKSGVVSNTATNR